MNDDVFTKFVSSQKAHIGITGAITVSTTPTFKGAHLACRFHLELSLCCLCL